jgi:hypothetical protein
MLTLYVSYFAPFDERRAMHWLLARHLLQWCNGLVSELNDWLQIQPQDHTQLVTSYVSL